MRGSLYDPMSIKWLPNWGMLLIPAHKVREMGTDELIRTALERWGDKPCFLTFDIDFVDPAYAPAPVPRSGRLYLFRNLDMLRKLKDLNYIGFDVVEVLPAYDHGAITSYMAANIVFEFLSILAAKKK